MGRKFTFVILMYIFSVVFKNGITCVVVGWYDDDCCRVIGWFDKHLLVGSKRWCFMLSSVFVIFIDVQPPIIMKIEWWTGGQRFVKTVVVRGKGLTRWGVEKRRQLLSELRPTTIARIDLLWRFSCCWVESESLVMYETLNMGKSARRSSLTPWHSSKGVVILL